MVVLCILWLSCFNDDTMFLAILCNFNASYYYHIENFILIDEAARTVVIFFVYGKAHLIDTDCSTCSTYVTT